MTKLIEIDDGLWVQPEEVAAVKRSGLEDGKCTVFMSGHPVTTDGFLIEREAEDAVSDINAALEKEAENG